MGGGISLNGLLAGHGWMGLCWGHVTGLGNHLLMSRSDMLGRIQASSFGFYTSWLKALPTMRSFLRLIFYLKSMITNVMATFFPPFFSLIRAFFSLTVAIRTLGHSAASFCLFT